MMTLSEMVFLGLNCVEVVGEMGELITDLRNPKRQETKLLIALDIAVASIQRRATALLDEGLPNIVLSMKAPNCETGDGQILLNLAAKQFKAVSTAIVYASNSHMEDWTDQRAHLVEIIRTIENIRLPYLFNERGALRETDPYRIPWLEDDSPA